MKNLFYPAILLSAAIVSCSEDQTNEVNDISNTTNTELVSINTYATTTRGDDTTTETLETSEYVLLHIDDNNSIQKSYTFLYSDGDWAQESTELKWSDITFPANFYSLHDGTEYKGLSFTSDVATYSDYTVSETQSVNHNDLVYHASKLNAIPTGGLVNAYHKHALSKINVYAATGTNKVYIARLQLVNFDDSGTVTITPLAADELSTANGAAWTNNTTFGTTYEYYYIGDNDINELCSTKEDGTVENPIINALEDAPLMIIPQKPTSAEVKAADGDGLVATITGTYVEVIYYMTDSADIPIVGYSAISARSDASIYTYTVDEPLYVMAAFPLGGTFAVNLEYDITLGLGVTGSTGGKLIADYYVNKDGEAISLTLNDDNGGTTESPVEIPEIDEGDDILGSCDDLIDIYVSDHPWSSGSSVSIEY